jgi:hypothetical protein
MAQREIWFNAYRHYDADYPGIEAWARIKDYIILRSDATVTELVIPSALFGEGEISEFHPDHQFF